MRIRDWSSDVCSSDLDGFQPAQLTRLALGVVADTQAAVVGSGRIDWTPTGVTSRGTFATADASLAAAFGPVTGLTTTLTFEDLINLRSEEHTSELQSLMRISYAVFCLNKKTNTNKHRI